MSAAKKPPRRRGVSPQGSGVVSIRAHASYRPDYSTLASSQVATARQKLGHTHAEFAEYLTKLLGWPVLESAVKRWETRKAPPGDALLACTAITQDDPYLNAPLLTAAPPSFPPEELSGHWATCYQFTHAGKPSYHADIAHITVGPGNHVRAVNHPPEPRSEGRGTPFRNEIDASLAGRHLIGEWRNTSDSRYYGTVQLAVLTSGTVMEGYYVGVDSDVEVSTGFWRWVRLDPGPIPVPGITLRDPHDLYDLVMAHSQYGAPLLLADVRGEP